MVCGSFSTAAAKSTASFFFWVKDKEEAIDFAGAVEEFYIIFERQPSVDDLSAEASRKGEKTKIEQKRHKTRHLQGRLSYI